MKLMFYSMTAVAVTPFNTKQIGGNGEALTHRREVWFYTNKKIDTNKTKLR